ncbi:sirohydrochlorin chelatase [Neobacillus dielmonensis]|uniref:sirohydrochlorin chelatase n=1 Tax=Neobacillus dielmonensis TaxID=1347369 RepID=UPI0005A6E632|nr:sirohydrochlorin chelatase [Neobacillus dielmonensis]
MRAILYIGHGTRSKKGAEDAKAFIHRVMERIPVPIQEISFLELTEPFIGEGFRRCVQRGATEITVVPLFLLAAGHIKEDIPAELSSLKRQFPEVTIDVRDPFGVQDKILDGIMELVRDIVVDLMPQDSILIVGRGSSDPSVHTAFSQIADGLQKRLGIEHVSVCYLAAAEPRFQEGLNTISNRTFNGRVIVIPYLLFSGLLLAEVNLEVRKRQKQGQKIIHTGPLSSHRIIEDIVIERAIGSVDN